MSNLVNGGATSTDGAIQAIEVRYETLQKPSPADTNSQLTCLSFQSQILAAGAPYGSPYAGLGLPPSVLPDIPVCIVFLVLFMACSASNVVIFVTNKKKGHKFGFSMAFNGIHNYTLDTCTSQEASANT